MLRASSPVRGDTSDPTRPPLRRTHSLTNRPSGLAKHSLGSPSPRGPIVVLPVNRL
jgi:hypothetical protein